MLVCQARLPYDSNCSKNRIYVRRRDGRVALTKESRSYKLLWEELIKEGTIERSFSPRDVYKVVIDAVVARTDYRSDPINIVDLLCDAVASALGVDDRIFAVRLDWVEGPEKIIDLKVSVVRKSALKTEGAE